MKPSEFWSHHHLFALRRVARGGLRYLRAATLLHVLVGICDDLTDDANEVVNTLTRPHTDSDYLLCKLPHLGDQELRQAFDDLVQAGLVDAAPSNPKVVVRVYLEFARISEDALRMRRVRARSRTRKRKKR